MDVNYFQSGLLKDMSIILIPAEDILHRSLVLYIGHDDFYLVTTFRLFVFRKFPFTYGLYLMLLVAPVVLIYIYTLLSDVIGMTSGIMILVMFLIQQLFIWAKAFTRIWTFASQYDYYLGRAF